jgi:hypothetical protein
MRNVIEEAVIAASGFYQYVFVLSHKSGLTATCIVTKDRIPDILQERPSPHSKR